MAASKKQVSQLVDILFKYVNARSTYLMLKEMAETGGNSSVQETFQRLLEEVARRLLEKVS